MDTATLEPPQHQEAAPAPKRTFPQSLPFDKQAIKLASIGGLSDADIATQYPGLTTNTLRKWRERDPAWAAAYYATREGRRKGFPPRVVREAREAQSQALTAPKAKHSAPIAPTDQKALSPLVAHDLITEGIPTLASRNRLRLAYEVDRALAKRTKSKRALPIASFAELNQAARALLYAEGRDADAPALTLNVWGNPGLQAQQSTGGFRDLPAIDAETNAEPS
jgi:hypothetical protein